MLLTLYVYIYIKSLRNLYALKHIYFFVIKIEWRCYISAFRNTVIGRYVHFSYDKLIVFNSGLLFIKSFTIQ